MRENYKNEWIGNALFAVHREGNKKRDGNKRIKENKSIEITKVMSKAQEKTMVCLQIP